MATWYVLRVYQHVYTSIHVLCAIECGRSRPLIGNHVQHVIKAHQALSHNDYARGEPGYEARVYVCDVTYHNHDYSNTQFLFKRFKSNVSAIVISAFKICKKMLHVQLLIIIATYATVGDRPMETNCTNEFHSLLD